MSSMAVCVASKSKEKGSICRPEWRFRRPLGRNSENRK
jgi:hypothetical protein